jgi:predicted SAM-dependent methyltransferase
MRRQIRRLLERMGYRVQRLDTRADTYLYQAQFERKSLDERRFYNIGAGGFSHPYWTNVDLDSEWYAVNRKQTISGIQHDLLSLEPLPIEDESAEVVYSSHTIEHITDAAALKLIFEAHRILKSGGYLRLTTPNIELDYRAYQADDRAYFYWIESYSIPANWQRAHYVGPLKSASTAQVFLAHFATSVSLLHQDGASERIGDDKLAQLFRDLPFSEALDYCTRRCPVEVQRRYPGNHINWWSKEKLFRMLREAGFSSARLSGYGQSFSPILRNTNYFDNTHPRISLYVEAVK